MLYPLRTEKAVKLMELDNTIMFVVDRRSNKQQIKSEVEECFKVKVKSVNTLIKQNRKIAYVKFAQENAAIDIATKLGLM